MALVPPDVLEVDDPQTTALVTNDVPACKVTVDEPQVMEFAHRVEEVLPAEVVIELTFSATCGKKGNDGPVFRW